MKEPNISVAIATFNEEKNLARCLKSISGWVKEIIVVDGSSTDKTRQIARNYGAKVIKTTNKPIFHINKQMAIDKCTGEWILQLDADEVVSLELKKELLSTAIDDLAFEAYFIPRKNFFLGSWLKKSGQYPDGVIRFFQNGKAKLPCKSVHEQMEVDGITGWLKNHLLHYPYPEFSDYLEKSNRYTSLSAKELIDQGRQASVFGLLAAFARFKLTFLSMFIRHKGFQDGIPGLIFCFYSGLHHLTSYIKFWEQNRKNKA